MNELKVFQNSEFGELSVMLIDGKEYFPATQCAKILGYDKPNNAIHQHCRYTLKQGIPHPQNPNKTTTVNFIPEGDLYRLIIRSKLPAAERFERFVFDEILPALRQTGMYIPNLDELINRISEAVTANVLDRLSQSNEPMQLTLEGKQVAYKFVTWKNAGRIDSLSEELKKEVYRMMQSGKHSSAVIKRFLESNGVTLSQQAILRYKNRHFDVI